MAEQEQILVIKLGALGDFIQALGAMAAIRAHHKTAHITLLTTKPFEGFARACPYFDAIMLDEKPSLPDLKGWLSLRQKLNALDVSRVYDLQNNDRTGFYFRLFRPRPEWVGIARGASHRNAAPDRTKGHAFYGHKQTLGNAGLHNIGLDDLSWVKADTKKFGLKTPYILMVPGSSPEHPQKRWPARHYATLAGYLIKLGYTVALLGTTAEKEVTDEIRALQPSVVDLNSQTNLFEIIALGRNAAACIGNDTGPMHMIAPTGCSCITLFSAHSNAQRHYPLGPDSTILQEKNLEHLPLERVLQTLHLEDKAQPKKSATLH